jgi:CRISPR-associated protein Cas1
LYGICHAALVTLGYSPALGFIHTGKALSFVYDVADLYKTQITIPVAFSVAASGNPDVEREARRLCRDSFVETRLLKTIVEDLDDLFSDGGSEDVYSELVDGDDPALPAGLWDPNGAASGGTNYADEASPGKE